MPSASRSRRAVRSDTSSSSATSAAVTWPRACNSSRMATSRSARTAPIFPEKEARTWPVTAVARRRWHTGGARISPMVIETTTFRVREGVGDAELLEADERVRTGVLYAQPGLVRATTARGDNGEWIVIVLWASPGDADAGAAAAAADD